MSETFKRFYVNSRRYPAYVTEGYRVLQDDVVYQAHNKRYYPIYSVDFNTEIIILDEAEIIPPKNFEKMMFKLKCGCKPDKFCPLHRVYEPPKRTKSPQEMMNDIITTYQGIKDEKKQ